jgi:hypothetical protein
MAQTTFTLAALVVGSTIALIVVSGTSLGAHAGT